MQSLSYSYSFSPELEQEWEWTEKYPTQPEILRYVNHVADRFGLRPDILFSTRVASAHYDDEAARWTVATDAGEQISAQFLIMATGCLSASKLPEIEGLERYGGRTHHTARWGKDEVRFDGLRVGVIGTGSSGIQSIPIIAEQAADLTVFQRTPNFSMPAGNRPLSADEVARDEGQLPRLAGAAADLAGGHPGSGADRVRARGIRRRARRQVPGSLGEGRPGLARRLLRRHPARPGGQRDRSRVHPVQDPRGVHDPEVAETLSPRSFPFGTKRPCLDSGYYATFNRPNVHLVDLRKTPLVEFTQAGLRTSEKDYEFDAIVFATGFDAMTGALTSIEILGRNGLSLATQWTAGPRTYLGVAMAGFPNLFTVTGPGSPSVLSNMVVSIEQHVEWITDCISYLRVARLRGDRGHRGGAGRVGAARGRGRVAHPVPQSQLLVHGRERAGQAAGVPALCRRRRACTGRSATRSRQTATRASRCGPRENWQRSEVVSLAAWRGVAWRGPRGRAAPVVAWRRGVALCEPSGAACARKVSFFAGCTTRPLTSR